MNAPTTVPQKPHSHLTPIPGPEVTFSSDTLAYRPQVLPLPNNHFVLAWEDGTDIFARLLDANGSFVGGNFLSVLTSNDPKQLSGPRLFRQTNGQVVVTYREQFGPHDVDVLWHLVDANFTPTGGAAPIENSALNEFLRDSTSRTGGGGAIVFETPQVFGQSVPTYTVLRFIDQVGNPTSDQIFVGPLSGETQQNAAVAGLHNGNVAVAYENYNGTLRDIRVRIYRPDGHDGGAGELHLSSGATTNGAFPAVAVLKDGSFVVAWQEYPQGIAFSHVSQEGVIDQNKPVNTVPQPPHAYLPKITALNDGGFLLAWTAGFGLEQDGSQNLDLFLQRYRLKSNVLIPVGTQVHIAKPGDQADISIATLPDGRVVLAYRSETDDTTDTFTLNYRLVFMPRLPLDPDVPEPHPHPPIMERQRSQGDTIEPDKVESDIDGRQPAAH
jgi:hypothetical protein